MELLLKEQRFSAYRINFRVGPNRCKTLKNEANLDYAKFKFKS